MAEERDETPVEEVTDHAAETTATTHEAVEETASHPEPTPKETAEDIPEWGKGVMQRLDAVEAQVAAPVEAGIETATGEELPEHGETIDESPVKPPWHGKSLKSIFGYH